MCESKPFSHDQSLCHELVQAFSEALSLRGDRRHCFKNGKDRSPRETLLSRAIFFFFERDELKCSSDKVCHELGGDGYWGPISVLWGRNGGPEPKVEPGRSPACARAAETWATSLHVTYSRRLETARDGDRIPRLVVHL